MVTYNFSTEIFSCMGDLQIVQLVRALRAAGHFTAVAITRPFGFEGNRRVQAAENLIGVLEEAAHLVVVVDQVSCVTLHLN